jgi:hypothetical protein
MEGGSERATSDKTGFGSPPKFKLGVVLALGEEQSSGKSFQEEPANDGDRTKFALASQCRHWRCWRRCRNQLFWRGISHDTRNEESVG